MPYEIDCREKMNRLVAKLVFCPEPPLTERRAIHESGAWRWVPLELCWCGECRTEGAAIEPEIRWQHLASHDMPAHWEPAQFATDPAASYTLEQKLNEMGLGCIMGQSPSIKDYSWCVRLVSPEGREFRAFNGSRLIAFCLAALRALNVAGCDSKPLVRIVTADIALPSEIESLMKAGSDHRGYEYAQLIGAELLKVAEDA